MLLFSEKNHGLSGKMLLFSEKNHGLSGKILLFSEKMMICPENFLFVCEDNMSGKFFELTSPPQLFDASYAPVRPVSYAEFNSDELNSLLNSTLEWFRYKRRI